MKLASYLLMGAGLVYAAVLAAGDDASPRSPAPSAALLGLGVALPATASVREGSIRGSSRRIHRSEQPRAFWVAVTIYYVMAGPLLVGAIGMESR